MSRGLAANRWTAVSYMLALVAVCAGALEDAKAQCETPKVTALYVWRAQSDIWTDYSARMTDELENQGYDDAVAYTCSTNPSCNGHFCQFQEIVAGGYNLWIDSHGGCVIESYEDSDDRDTRWAQLKTAKPQWFTGEAGQPYLYRSTTGNGSQEDPFRYVICITQSGADAWSASKLQIIFIGGCATETYFDDYNGGLELGYHASPNASDYEPDARELFRNMSGEYNNGAKRRSGDALALQVYTNNFRYSGTIKDDMVLAPAVKDRSP